MVFSRLTTPNNLVYVLGHLVLIIGGYMLFKETSGFWSAIGASIAAAGLTGWASFLHVFLSQRQSDQLRVLDEFGIINVLEARSVRFKAEYDRRLAGARKNIDVMGFGLRAFREDYFHNFVEWKQRAHVRILLLDPEFPNGSESYAMQRDGEEQNSQGTIQSDVRTFVRDVAGLIGDGAHGSFNVRLYRCLPSINVFRVDDELFWGPYLIKEQSRNTPTIVLRRGGGLFQRVIDHFERIWTDDSLSRAVPDSWIEDHRSA